MKKLTLVLGLIFAVAAGLVWRKVSAPIPAQTPRTPTVGHAHVAPVADIRPTPTGIPTQLDAREAPHAHAAHVASGAILGVNGPVTLADLPTGEFRQRFLRLSPEAQAVTLAQLAKLKIPVSDLAHLQISSGGRIYYVRDIPAPDLPSTITNKTPAATASDNTTSPDQLPTKTAESAASATVPIHHSRPGAGNVIFLDFDGATIPADSEWARDYNDNTAFSTRPYDTDGNTALFSDTEQAVITRTWERVAEDFRPFDVDVTTEQPAVMGANVAHVVITRATRDNGAYNPAAADSGGVAFLDNFGADHAPAYAYAFVYHNHVLDESGMADAISHETGHYIGGLRHDGGNGEAYYEGHGSGDTSWGPIMGSPYNKNVTQWSKGEYFGYTNPAAAQDDLALLTSKLGAIADDHGDSNASATAIAFTGNSLSATGVIGATGEADRFVFTTQAGDINLRADPFRSGAPPNGGNLDILIQLLDASGNVIVSANPAGETGASILASVGAGTYYVRISPVGVGNPTTSPPSGYTDYGSLGYYQLTGNYSPGALPEAPIITAHPASVTVAEGASAYFNATASGTPTPTYRWQRLPAGGGTWDDINDNASYTGTASPSLSVNSTSYALNGDQYRVRAINSEGTAYSNAATLTIQPELQGATPIIWGRNDNGQANIPPGLGSIIGIAGGWHFTLALKANHTVAGWGAATHGQLNFPANLTNVRQIAAGGNHGVALKSDGTVVAWGDSPFGDLGPAAQVPAGLANVVAIAAGGSNSMALKSDGTVVVWGWGKGSTMPNNLNNVVQISSGALHFLALKSDGTVAAWGSSSSGATEVPPGLNNVVAISAGDSFSLALRQDGTVVAWGYNNVGQCNVPTGLNDVVAIAAGGDFSMALKSDGSIVAWGGNSQGQLNIPVFNNGALKIAAGYSHGIALALAVPPIITSHPANVTVNEGDPASFSVAATGTAPLSYQWKHNGTLITNGNGTTGALTNHLSITNTAATDAGAYTVVVGNAGGSVTSNAANLTVGTPPPTPDRPTSRVAHEGGSAIFTITPTGTGPFTYQWRHHRQIISGATGNTLNLNDLSWEDRGYYEVWATGPDGGVARSVFYLHVALANPTLVSWSTSQYDSAPTPPPISGSVASIAFYNQTGFAVKGDGTIVGWGSNSSDARLATPDGLANVVSVAIGLNFVVALKNDGTLVGWGDNSLGQLAPLSTLSDVVAISAGDHHCVALKSDGTLVGWGYTNYGQEVIPVGLKDVVAISTSLFNTIALKSDGSAIEWGHTNQGYNKYEGPSNISKVSAGGLYSAALLQDGTVRGWGRYTPTYNPGISGITAITTQGAYFLALKSDGTVVGWGDNYEGQTHIPSDLTGVVAIESSNWANLALLRTSAPVVLSSPGSQTVTAGDFLELHVQVAGTIPLTYQWRRNGQNLTDTADMAGAQSPTLVFSKIQKSDEGDYDVIVTNNTGFATSSAATVTVLAPPQFAQRPLSRILLEGQPFSINGTATSTSAISYIWKRNGQVIPGATAAIFSRSSATSADNGHYEVVATDGISANHSYFHLKVIGGDTTNLTVLPWGQNQYGSSGPSTIPANMHNVVEIAAGTNHALALKSDGTITAWGINNFGGTSVPSGLNEVIAISAGYYHSLALKADGTVVSWGRYFNAPLPPPDGLRNIIAISANGNTNLALRSDGTVVAWGISEAPANLNGVVAIAAGSGRGSALKADGTVVSWGNTRLDYKPMPDDLTDIVAISGGEDHTLALRANGQVVGWGRNDLGQADSPAGLSNVSAIAGGFVHSIALKSDGTVAGWGRDNEGEATPPTGLHNVKGITSGSYYNLVLVPSTDLSPAIASQPGTRTTYIGTPASFNVTVSGMEPMTYRWQRLAISTSQWVDLTDGADYTGATSNTLTVNNPILTMDRDQFRVTATNDIGTAISNAATLRVFVPMPVITTHPTSQIVVADTEITLAVTATSPVDLTYQWRLNGSPIPGATATSYTIPSMQPGNEGGYSVVVINSAGSVVSNTATLAIATVPDITTQPTGRAVYSGQPVTFSVSATSNAPLSYQWRFEGEPIPNATSAAYTIASAQPANAGTYSVVVSTIAGSRTSATATLTVTPTSVPVITRHPANASTPVSGIVVFSIEADGSPSPAYQWQRSANGTGPWTDLNELQPLTYVGVTTTDLTLLNQATLFGNQGDAFRCVVSNVAGQAVSNSAALTTVPQAGPVRIASGNNHMVFVDALGNAWGSGRNQEGQLGDGSGQSRLIIQKGLPNFRTVAAGSEHTLFINFDGTLLGSGYNEYGALGTGNYANASSPVIIASNVSTTAGGHRHSLFSKTDGTLWAMGWNQAGQLGDGTTADRLSPVQVSDHVVVVAAGYSHSVFIKSDGSIWAMGANTYGQFGTGITTASLTPIQIGNGGRAAAVGFYHTLFLKTDNSLWGAGYNGSGQLGDGTGTQRITAVPIANGVQAIAAGATHSLYLKIDGTLWGMGDNSHGQLGTGDTTNRLSPVQIATGVAGIGAGLYSSYYLKTDGSLWAMGANPQGQLGTGDSTDRLVSTQVYTGVGSLPQSPIQPTATQSDEADRITVTWTGSIGASHFDVWRHSSADRSSATRIANYITGNFFEDFTATPGVTYYYWVDPANPYGRRNSSGYAMGRAGVVSALPYFTTHPQSQTVTVGGSVTFTAAIQANEPLAIKWRKNGVDIPNSTSPEGTFTINSATTADAGEYRAVIVIPGHTGEDILSEPATLTVNKIPQTITTDGLPNMNYTDSGIEIGATATSGLPVEFSVVSGPAHRHAANPTLILDNVGTVTVRLTQPGDASHAPAPDIEFSFTVSPAPITLAFAESTLTKTYNGIGLIPPTVQTTPYIPTTFTITFDGSTTIPINAGSYTVVATINDPRYSGSVTATYTINRAVQYIYGGGPGSGPLQFTPPEGPVRYPYAEAVGGPVILTVDSGPGRMDGQKLTITGAGTIILRGTQAGSQNYLPAPDKIWELVVTPAAQSLVFVPLADRPFSSTPITLTANATSGLPAAFSVLSGPATISGNQLTLTGAGTVSVRATQSGNVDYLAATPVDQSFTVAANALSWSAEHFTTGELSDPAISGPTADPDGDGLTNLLEYALGLAPKQADTTGGPEMGSTATDWTYTYTRPADRPDLTYEVEYSTDLAIWSSSGVTLTKTIDGANQTWQATVPLGTGPSVFLRLKVTQN